MNEDYQDYDTQYADDFEDDADDDVVWQFDSGVELTEGQLREYFAHEFAQANEDWVDDMSDMIDTAEQALGRPLRWAEEAVPLVQAFEAGGAAAAEQFFENISEDLSDDDRAALLAEMIDDGEGS